MNNPPTTDTNKKHECERTLRVFYTDPERLELGKQLAATHSELAQINADLDRIKSEFKSKVSAAEAQILDLSNKVGTGHHMILVKCRWRMDSPKAGRKQLFRLDTTPHEVVQEEDMSAADKQIDLTLEERVDAALANGPAKISKKDISGVSHDGTVAVPSDGKPIAGEQK